MTKQVEIVSTSATGEEVSVAKLRVLTVNGNWDMTFVDETDPENPKTVTLRNSMGINLEDEINTDRQFAEKPVFETLTPLFVKALVKDYDPTFAKVKKVKDLVNKNLLKK